MKKSVCILALLISIMAISTAATVQGSLTVWVDVKPGSCPNSINRESRGKVPVAIMGTSSFDTSNVDPPIVMFAGASPLMWAWEDVDGNGRVDLVLHFKTQELVGLQSLSPSKYSVPVTLTGQLLDGTPFEGEGWVRIVK